MLREHKPLVIEDFNGLWARGDAESCPLDHFIQAENIQFIHSGFKTRDPLDKYQAEGAPLGQILRIYTYVMQSGQSLLILTEGGKIYHAIDANTIYGPILTIPAMTDFGFTAIAGRAYITPFSTITNARGTNYEVGLLNEFVYVYKGDGTPARKAAGFPPTNGGYKPLVAYEIPNTGVVTAGTHAYAVAFMGTGAGNQLSPIGPEVIAIAHSTGDKQVQLDNIPIGPTGTNSRVIAMTKIIDAQINAAQITKTFSWTTGLEGWIDSGIWPNMAYDSTDHVIKFAGTPLTGVNVTGNGVYGTPTVTTWETLGVPAGATVTGVQITGLKRKLVAYSNISSASLSITLAALVYDSGLYGISTVDITGGAPLLTSYMPLTPDAGYTAETPGGPIPISAVGSPSNTMLSLQFAFHVDNSTGSTGSVDARFDDLAITIFYKQQVTALFSGDVSTFIYYDVFTIPDNVTTNLKINTADASLILIHTPGLIVSAPTTTALLVQQIDKPGNCDLGLHLVGVVFETDTGYLTAPGPEYFGAQTYTDTTKTIKVSNIPLATNSAVVKRHLVSTKAIFDYNGNQLGYLLYFIPDATLTDNTTTTMELSYFDADLLEDASHLLDNFSEIPAFVGLTTYHGRLIGYGEYGNISVARVSAPGEPEAISQVDGLIIVPLDGYPITNAQEYRDILYLFKRTRTIGTVDNEDVPSSWLLNTVDQGIGAPVHGVATVLDSGGVNIDFLIIADLSGVMIFNGIYSRPELSWKIGDFWSSLAQNEFHHIQVINDTVNKKGWITLPPPLQHELIHFDYTNGLDPKNIKFAIWKYDVKVSCLAIIEIDRILIGALENASY
jgi:hypothetical protein